MKFFLTIITLVVLLPSLSACLHSGAYTSRIEKRFPPAGKFIEQDGERIHVIARGTSGPPVLMIHGASANAEEFTQTLTPRLEETHRVLMIDRPGHGYSSRPDGSDTLAVQAAMMATALEELVPGEKSVIVGHSFGGAVALRLALDRPDLVSSVVLLAPVTHDWGTDAQAWYTKVAARPVIGRAFSRLVPLAGPGQLEEGIVGVFHPDTPPENYAEASAAPLLFRPAEFRANARDVANLRTELAIQESRYGALTMPITLYSGLQDTVIKPELHAGKLKRQVSQLDLIELPNGGHMPHHAQGAQIAETIRRLSSGANSQ